MRLLDGKDLAARIRAELKAEVTRMKKEGKTVALAVIQVGDNPASSVYVKNKIKACEQIGIAHYTYLIGEDITESELIELINLLNNNEYVDGILVQLPLPAHINESAVINAISPEKDVDGFHESNVGKLMIGDDSGFVPCTTRGIIELLKANAVDIEGKNCVVVGRSNIVGKPTAIELLRDNGTVTVCHSKTKGLKYICRAADILVCAIGQPKFFNRKYISPGTVVVDVGIHRLEDGRLCGDVDYEDVIDIVSAITPVPGGVGPMTVAMLMANTVESARRRMEE